MISFLRKFRQKTLIDKDLKKYLLYATGEIVLVVIGILIALQINNWNNAKINHNVEINILKEISNGLQEDLIDVNSNIQGHQRGLQSCDYWKKIIENQAVDIDSVSFFYWYLTRNFGTIQNTSSYESLKSRGLELITNNSLRFKIISLYEQEYTIIKTLEENYEELQFHKNYFKEINQIISPYFIFNADNEIITLKTPLNISVNNKNEILSYLWKIKKNRKQILNYYEKVAVKIQQLKIAIDKKIAKN